MLAGLVNRYAIAAVLGAGIVLGVLAHGYSQYRKGVADGRNAVMLELREAAERTRQRVREADVGTGDADDDMRWLIERLQSSGGDGAPGAGRSGNAGD